ncbi:MAG TPA: hypothetical protein VHT50_29120 [Mycobacterium sp.]|nr:hypothetical protein [Mycobacterium sp.]
MTRTPRCSPRVPPRCSRLFPDDVRSITELRNPGGSLDWATAWLRVTPQRLFSFAERAWRDASRCS